MFSFIKKYAAGIHSVDIYANIAMLLFLIVFVGMIAIALKADKAYISHIEHLPLD
ncbi:MAG: CcoQ/FixQ family Cbb3-type cytochrome c oxidase assembly chaperone [Chitinophagales bacterium]|nr:CcoQ/FixQ family Cbb3-type cytochrome c oxidase assembly chaperone [Chitinophagales bacterium]